MNIFEIYAANLRLIPNEKFSNRTKIMFQTRFEKKIALNFQNLNRKISSESCN